MAAKRKSARQVRFLFSKGSPLSKGQKGKLVSELRSGKVKITKRKRRKRRR